MNRVIYRTNVDGLVRDVSTAALINTNDNDYMVILKEREKAKRLAKLEKEVEVVKNELQSIKNLIANRDQ